MPMKDVCYITTDNLEPVYLKGQIVSIKEPNSEWSKIERGDKNPQNPKMRFAVKTIMIAKAKLKPSVKKESRLVIIKKNNRDYVDVVPKYIPPEIY
tara:strand:- start:796 stop:1083 length:288 start_codon:yes stop_codon:yes gene_type:complete